MAKEPIFSLDTYEKQANEDYGSYEIRVDADTVVTLKNPLRVKDAKRTRLFEVVQELSFDKENPTAEDVARITPLMIEIMELVGDDNVSLLIDRISGDLSVTMAIFKDYFKAVGLGEASNSES